jgi:hypothetical protein
MTTIEKLILDAKEDGDTLDEFVSTLPAHLTFLVQSGKFKLEKEISEYVVDARSLWHNISM